MATRSTIAIRTEDGIKAIYAHWDGYIEHNGRILREGYKTTEQVDALIELGDISQLGLDLDLTVAYGRDKGDAMTDVEPQTFETIAEWVTYFTESYCEFYYLFDGQDWIVSKGKKDADGNFEFDFLEVAMLKEIVN
ncbi:hypothetical protein OAP94_01980 [bacterium]|nr:hypothetical protein [bacterium]MDC1007432.1 hypothetical protein [bacterium]